MNFANGPHMIELLLGIHETFMEFHYFVLNFSLYFFTALLLQ